MSGPASVVGRLAPSPTGRLHVGHARSFLLAWWSVRSQGGRVLLRIEDLDRERSKPELVGAALADLEWLGLDWDGRELYQSRETAAYERAVDALLREGNAYPCVCSRREIRAALGAPHGSAGEMRYPGTCRGRYADAAEAEAATGRTAGVRLIVPSGPIEIADAFAGDFAADVQAEVGDFLLARRDGAFAYQLAVVVDDARQGVTEVLRGDDLLPSTPRQWLLQRALQLPHPTWVHVPLVVDVHGRRLAKRDGDLALSSLRERGCDPRRLVAWVARSAGLDVSEPVHAADVLSVFDPARVPRDPVVLDPVALAQLV